MYFWLGWDFEQKKNYGNMLCLKPECNGDMHESDVAIDSRDIKSRIDLQN